MSVAGLRAQLVNANRGYRALFFQALETNAAIYDPIINAIAERVPSMSSDESHSFSHAIPSMEEWIDERPISRLGVDGFTIPNRSYANGIEIDRDHLADDKLGIFAPRIRGLAEAAARHKMNLIRDLLNNGDSAVGYDAVNFFATTHPRDSGGTQSNLLTTAALDDANYEAAVQQLEGLTDEVGEPLAVEATHLIVPTNLRHTAAKILNASTLASGATNINAGTASLLVVKGLTASNWFVADLGKSLKPIIFQDRQAVQFIGQDNPTDEQMFNRKKFRFGSDYRGAMGYAFWQTIVQSQA